MIKYGSEMDPATSPKAQGPELKAKNQRPKADFRKYKKALPKNRQGFFCTFRDGFLVGTVTDPTEIPMLGFELSPLSFFGFQR